MVSRGSASDRPAQPLHAPGSRERTTCVLPSTYPHDTDGTEVGWERRQPVGQIAWAQDEAAIAYRSAAARPGDEGEQLARFVHGREDRLRVRRRRSFDDWFA